MTTFLDSSGVALQPVGEPRLIAAVMVDGLTMLAEERGDRWYHPMKLMPAPGRPPMPMLILQACKDAEFMQACPQHMLYTTYSVVKELEALYRMATQEIRARKSGIHLAGVFPR